MKKIGSKLRFQNCAHINFVFNKSQRLLEVKVFISPWVKHVSQNRGILKVYTKYPNFKKINGSYLYRKRFNEVFMVAEDGVLSIFFKNGKNILEKTEIMC